MHSITDRWQYDANSRSYCVTVRLAKMVMLRQGKEEWLTVFSVALSDVRCTSTVCPGGLLNTAGVVVVRG